MTWKGIMLKNRYEHQRQDTFNGNGIESNWRQYGSGLTYEDYWIYVCIVGHAAARSYRIAHGADVEVMRQKTAL